MVLDLCGGMKDQKVDIDNSIKLVLKYWNTEGLPEYEMISVVVLY